MKSLSIAFLIMFAGADIGFGVVQYPAENLNFVRKKELLKPSIENLTFSDKQESLPVPVKKLKIRAKKGKPNAIIEAINLTLPKNEIALKALVRRISRKGHANQLLNRFLTKMRDAGATEKESLMVYLDIGDLKLISASALSRELARGHRKVDVRGLNFEQDRTAANLLLAQISDFLSPEKRRRITSKIRAGASLSVERDLLPPFAERVVRKYLVYRGPNCFHAALAFHGQQLTKSKFINVKEEKGYHESMINYDELWRAINKEFHEVDPVKSPLKYGDMLVFFNVPDEPYSKISFRWIRHTATYLFGPYTFSKGSKSPDTPYTIKTLDEEWNTWLGYTTNLGVKVFRRNSKYVSGMPSPDLIDWMY